MPRFNPFRKDPNAAPPDKVRILDVSIEPWDTTRFKVMLRITPFQKLPNIEFSLLDEQGLSLGDLTILESIDTDLVVTIHHKRNLANTPAAVSVRLFYPDLPEVDLIIHKIKSEA